MKTRIITALLIWMAVINLQSVPSPVAADNESILVETLFKGELGAAADSITLLQQSLLHTASPAIVKQRFIACRQAYKKIEFLVAYYYPHLIRTINGPALPFADGENSKAILPPEGFQVLEEKLFSPGIPLQHKKLIPLTTALLAQFRSMQQQSDPYGFMSAYLFDAMRFEIYRIIAHGITGFDSPIAQHSMTEAAAALEGVETALLLYSNRLADTLLQRQTTNCFHAATLYLRQHTAFPSFDRLHFITTYANPLSSLLLQWQQQLLLQLPPERRILSPLAPHLFAMAYYNPNGYSPNYESDPTAAKIILGKKLFLDPVLSGNLQRSCASCHHPEKAFTDGRPKSPTLDGKSFTSRNTPTLFNVGFQNKFFYDSRAVFIEAQVFEVVHNKTEMNGSLPQAVKVLQQDTTYTRLFLQAFPYTAEKVSQENITNAIASYLRSLTSLQSRFDAYMNGSPHALTAPEKDGFNIFMGKGKCGTCHFAPLFNGVAPPYFAEPESEVLGVPATDQPHSKLDSDPGKFILYGIPIERYSFKTPSVRNSGLTAPYMHNGVFRTLEAVVDFYDKGGGAGLHIAPTNQTLPAEPLHLTSREKQALVAFMRSLTDTNSYKAITNYGLRITE